MQETLDSLVKVQEQIRELATVSATYGEAIHIIFAGNLLEIVSDFVEAEELRIELEEKLNTNPGPLPPFNLPVEAEDEE